MLDTGWHVRYKLDNVKMFINRALSVDDKYIRIAANQPLPGDYEEYETDQEISENDPDDDPGFAEYEKAVDIVLSYQEIVARAALNEINLIVEYELKRIASFIKVKNSGKSWQEAWINSRKSACKLIENTTGIELKNLSGAGEVEKVRKIINSFKHDDGYSEEYEPYAGEHVEMQKQYKLDFDEIIKYADAAKSFLKAIPGERPKYAEDIPRRMKFNRDIGS